MCVSKLTIIGSDHGLSSGRHQSIIWTNAGVLLIRSWGTNFSEILIKICISTSQRMHLKMLSAKCCPSCFNLNVLNVWPYGHARGPEALKTCWNFHLSRESIMHCKLPINECQWGTPQSVYDSANHIWDNTPCTRPCLLLYWQSNTVRVASEESVSPPAKLYWW